MPNESIGAIILSPRQIATGDPAGSALENINTHPIADGAICYVSGGAGKGSWQLDKSSTENPGTGPVRVVIPISGPGRWIKAVTTNLFMIEATQSLLAATQVPANTVIAVSIATPNAERGDVPKIAPEFPTAWPDDILISDDGCLDGEVIMKLFNHTGAPINIPEQTINVVLFRG